MVKMKKCPWCKAEPEPLGEIAFAINHKPDCFLSLNNQEWNINEDEGARMIVQRYDVKIWNRRGL